MIHLTSIGEQEGPATRGKPTRTSLLPDKQAVTEAGLLWMS